MIANHLKQGVANGKIAEGIVGKNCHFAICGQRLALISLHFPILAKKTTWILGGKPGKKFVGGFVCLG
jgi:hypothetical protein